MLLPTLKTLARKALSKKNPPLFNSTWIFNFHDVSPPTSAQYSSAYSTDPDCFAEQIDFLEKKFQFISLDELVNPEIKREKKPLAAITFDDGFYSILKYAGPILKNKKIPFLVFLCKEAVLHNRLQYEKSYELPILENIKEKIYLNEEDIFELQKLGASFGSHSSFHENLNSVPIQAAKESIKENKAYLEKILHKEILHFAIPYGKSRHFNEELVKYCAEIGHEYIYTSQGEFFLKNNLSCSPKIIPRISLLNEGQDELTFKMNRALLTSLF